MRKQRRKVLLFLDNATSHPADILLKNVQLKFFPPNTTSKCQPLDQGIIQNFKVWYHWLVTTRILAEIEKISSADKLTKKITVLDAVMWIHTAVSEITSACVFNCFKKAGFGIPHKEDEENDEYESASDVGCISNEDVMKRLPECLQDYFDNDLATEADSEDVTLFIPGAHEEVESDDDDQCVQENPKISISETKDLSLIHISEPTRPY